MKLILYLTLLALASCAFGQQCIQTVPISLLDEKSGLAITELPRNALQARQGRTVLPITAVEPIQTRRLLVLVDESGSITGAAERPSRERTTIRTTLGVLNDLLGNNPATLSIEYGLFDDQCVFGDSFTANVEELRHKIADVNGRFVRAGHGTTAIYDALHAGLMRFEMPRWDDAVLVVTDGEDTASKRSASDLEAEYRASGVRLFTVLVKNWRPPPQLEAERNSLVSLVHLTGGGIYELIPDSPIWSFEKSTQAAVHGLRRFWKESVLSGYLLHVQLPPNFQISGKWNLEVNRAVDPRLKNAVLNYPDRLRPCSKSEAASR